MATINHWYKLDETTGTNIVDSGSLAMNATLTNSTANLNTVSGVIGSALKFDGVNDYARVPTNAYINSSKFSISFWMKKQSGAIAYFITRWGYGISGTPTQWAVIWDTGGIFEIYFRHGTVLDGYTYCPALNVNTVDTNWHHVVYTHDATVGNGVSKIYVDSVLNVTKNHTTGPIYNNGNHYIDIGGSPSAYFPGSLDQIKIYNNDVLTQSEVNDLFNEQFPLLCWNYRAKYKNSNRMFTVNGGGKFPTELKIPSSVDASTGVMMDEGILISSDKFKVIQ